MTSRNDIFTHKTESFDFYVEYTALGMCFIHQDVRVWNKTTLKDTLLIIESLDWMELRVCALPDSQLIKYSALYGFKYSYSQTSPDGVEYHILSRR